MTLTESDLSARLGEIYTAALGVFKEEGTLTFPAVARHSRTEPEDLARRWACPADLLIEALVDGIFPIPADPGDRGLRAELLEITIHLATEFTLHGDLLISVMSRLPGDRDLNRAFREQLLLPRVEIARRIFGRAMLRGELRPDTDPRMIFSLVPALMSYRTMLRDPPPDPAVAEHLVDILLLPLLLRA